MRARLKFKLPEERDDFETAIHARAWRNAVSDIVTELRRRVKYGNAGAEMNDFYDWVWQLLNEDGLDPWG
jgi:hypothetical protein